MRAHIGADALIYQDVDAMKRAVAALNPEIKAFEASCFDGVYITGVDEGDISRMQGERPQAQGGDDDDA